MTVVDQPTPPLQGGERARTHTTEVMVAARIWEPPAGAPLSLADWEVSEEFELLLVLNQDDLGVGSVLYEETVAAVERVGGDCPAYLVEWEVAWVKKTRAYVEAAGARPFPELAGFLDEVRARLGAARLESPAELVEALRMVACWDPALFAGARTIWEIWHLDRKHLHLPALSRVLAVEHLAWEVVASLVGAEMADAALEEVLLLSHDSQSPEPEMEVVESGRPGHRAEDRLVQPARAGGELSKQGLPGTPPDPVVTLERTVAALAAGERAEARRLLSVSAREAREQAEVWEELLGYIDQGDNRSFFDVVERDPEAAEWWEEWLMKEPPASLGELLCQQWWKLEDEKGTGARITREQVVGLLELTQEASLLGEVFLTADDTEPFDSGAALNLVSALGDLAEESADQPLWELAARIAEAALGIAQDEHLSRWLGDYQTQREIGELHDPAALLREAERSRRDADLRRTRAFYEAAVERAEEGEDADLFVNALSRLILYLCATGKRPVAADYLTVYPDHDLELMEALGRRVLDQAHDEGNTTASWLAVGSLGRTLERAGRVEEALPLWQEALAAGSDDPVTADRLSLYLERQRRHWEAISVIEAALPRLEALDWVDLRAVDVLRRRLLRCRDRLLGRPRRGAPGIFIRAGEGFLEPDFRAAAGKGISSLTLGPDAAHCAAHRQGEALLLDVDLVSGLVLREANGLPPVPDGAILRAETGHAFAIGGRHSGAAWACDPDGSNLARLSFPHRITQAVWIGGVWVVSSDRGGIFGVVPGSGIAWADESFSPYRLTACGGLAIATTLGQMAAYSPGGEVVWEASVGGVVWHLGAGRDLVVAGDNHGRLHFLDGSGALLGSQEIADWGGDVALAVDWETTVVWNGNRLFFFSRPDLEVSPEVTLEYEYPGAGVDGVAAWGRLALLWSRQRMYVASRRGKVLWMGDFPKRRIFAVATQGPRIFVAGEALWALRAGADGA